MASSFQGSATTASAEISSSAICKNARPSQPRFQNSAKHWFPLLGGILLSAPLAVLGYWEMFGQFRPYDDQGYLMMTARLWFEGHPLYNQVVTPYGPFYYLYCGLLYRVLHLPLTTDGVRLCTLAHWLLIAGLLSWFIFTLTRDIVIALAAQAILFWTLHDLCFEPMHPQDILLIGSALLLCTALLRGRVRLVWIAAAQGAICAAMLLSKTNIGIFAATACLAVWASAARRTRPATFGAMLIAVGALSMPALLMHGSWSNPAWTVFTGFVVASIVGVLAASAMQRRQLVSTAGPAEADLLRTSGAFLLAGSIAASLILAFTVTLGGSSLRAVLDGIVTRPQRMAGSFGWPINITNQTLGRAGASMVVAIALACGVHSRPAIRRAAPLCIVSLKALVGLATLALLTRNSVPRCFTLLVPLTWLVMVSAEEEAVETHWFARALLAWLAVMESLWVYPVPGTQIMCAMVLPATAGLVNLCDAVRWIRRKVAPGPGQLLYATTSVMVVVACGLLLGKAWQVAGEQYAGNVPLDLPGAHRLRLHPNVASTVRRLARALSTQSDTFIASDGLNSFYFWTGERPPGPLVVGHALGYFTAEERQALLTSVLDHPRSCFILQPPMSGSTPAYVDFVNRAQRYYKPWFVWEDNLVMVRRDRPLPPPPPSQQ